MKEITVAVIGSGSTYCPELVDGFIKAQSSLKLKKISFMDIDERKRTIVGNLCLRMLKKAGIECETLLTDNLDEALQGADFVVTQIRVGMLHARYLDETIPLKYDLIGQETTGMGGFFKALRTIPVMQHICDRIEAICPDAWLINFTNPSGIITEFVLNHTNVKCMGLCNVPINMIDDTKEAMGDDCDITYVGLNHLSWITSVKKDGKELIDDMLAQGFSTKVMANIKDDGFSLDCLNAVRGIPSSYLQYYYCRDAKLKHQKEDEKCRARVCMEIEEELLEMYSNETLVTKPDLLEIAAVIGKDGAEPVAIDKIENKHIIGLMRVVKAYEKYTVEAATTGSEAVAINALLVHPLVGDWERAHKCFEEMKWAHKAYLPEFFPNDVVIKC